MLYLSTTSTQASARDGEQLLATAVLQQAWADRTAANADIRREAVG